MQIKHAELESNWILQCTVHDNSENEVIGMARISMKEILDEVEVVGVKRTNNEPAYFESIDFNLILVPPNAKESQTSGRVLLRMVFATYQGIQNSLDHN